MIQQGYPPGVSSVENICQLSTRFNSAGFGPKITAPNLHSQQKIIEWTGQFHGHSAVIDSPCPMEELARFCKKYHSTYILTFSDSNRHQELKNRSQIFGPFTFFNNYGDEACPWPASCWRHQRSHPGA